jgi:hypothetical protein
MIKITAVVMYKDEVVFYAHGHTQKDVWDKIENKCKLDVQYTVSLHTERTHRVSGTKFRYCDPANPTGSVSSYKYFTVLKTFDQIKRDFSTVFTIKTIAREFFGR